MEFEFAEDKIFFKKLLGEEYFEKYKTLFDFRPVDIKRKDFSAVRNKIFEELVSRYGLSCMLHFKVCDSNSGFAVDHLLPLSTNQLNKKLRRIKPERGKKVRTQSIGSNHWDNLVIACNKCNGYKKQRLLKGKELLEILNKKTG